jgi:hypothetical protein
MKEPKDYRWTYGRKAAIVKQFIDGEIDLETVLSRYDLTIEEFNEWISRYEMGGKSGLRVSISRVPKVRR